MPPPPRKAAVPAARRDPKVKDNEADKAILWPSIPPTAHLPLELVTLLEDQIVTIPHFFTSKECASLVSHAMNRLAFAGPKPPGRDEAVRTNHRWTRSSPADLALLQAVWSRLRPVLQPAGLEGERAGERPAGLHCNVRMYRYDPGQLFKPHYDDSLVDPLTGLISGWTLLIYLSGLEDGVVGGETVFYTEGAGRKGAQKKEPVVARLERGTALLHRHGTRCMLHEARPVEKGTKWVLRSDLLFEKPA